MGALDWETAFFTNLAVSMNPRNKLQNPVLVETSSIKKKVFQFVVQKFSTNQVDWARSCI